MIGDKEHPRANDGAGHRIAIAETILARLAQDVSESPTVHQVSIVEFGSSVAIPISALTLAHTPADKGLPLRQANAAASMLKARNMEHTHTYEALAQAAEELRKMAATKSGGGPRKRHVLLVTDGRPYETGVSKEARWQRVEDATKQLTGLGADLWVVGLDDHSEYWPTDGAVWQRIAGSPHRAAQANGPFPEMQKLVNRFVNQWLGSDGVAPLPGAGDRIVLPPYLGRAVFEVHARERIAPPRVIGPGEVVVPRQGGDVPGLVSFHVAEAPLPGEYRVETPTGIAVLTLANTEAPRLTKVSPGPTSAKGMATTIRFKAGGVSSEKPMQEDIRHPISAEIEVTGPDGTTQRRPARLDGDGIFSAPWTPSATGDHQVRLNASYRGDDGKGVPLFPGQSSQTVTVSEAPLTLELASPAVTGRVAVSPGQDGIAVTLTLVEGEGGSVDTTTTIRDPASWLQAWPVDSSGVVTGAAIPVGFGDGQFHFQLPVSFDVMRGEGWLRPKPVSFRLSLAPDRVLARDGVYEMRLPPGSKHLRIHGDPLSAGPLAAAYPWWLLAVLAALAALAVVALGVVLFFALGRNWLLSLTDSRRDHDLKLSLFELNADPGCLSPVLNESVLRQSKLDLAGKVRRRKATKDPQVFQWLRVRRSWQNRGDTVTIEFQFKGDTRKRDRLVLSIGPQGRDFPPFDGENWRVSLRQTPRTGSKRFQNAGQNHN